ncbi:ParB/RepB/Spo0J family partition protein [Pseudogracilibacillus auburnensis]|uniref:Chromosome segregation DNA-binding protein n=1 Tax=Pseudogracilibacillus auburnensis TaxID=1494959 RepID=A0A2V3VSB3_9BACI|nr:ParB/RepB/Spo0J family partition protein [Pseudogracilibacillus auburnensis]PXW83598.1 chromosome segregation DNA-binding protein [Pseudogracilibacillus auburnensis]
MAKRLGKGLGALINVEEESIEQLSIDECRTNPYQPRKTFDADAIEELKISILEYGIIQPLIVRRSIKGYEIVAGERRFRAAREAGLKEIPAIIKDFDDKKMMEIALLENLQREDLTVIEEALAYKNLINELHLTQEELSNKLGKSRSHIANTMRLLSLPEDIIIFISNGELSMGHGRALLGLKNKEQLHSLVDKIRKNNLNVRQVEQMINELNKQKPLIKKKKKQKDLFIQQQETKLREVLGTNVNIQKTKNKGKIEIEFYTTDELERLISMLQQ